MIDIKILRENPNFIQASAEAKNVSIDIDKILELDRKVKRLQQASEEIAAKKNDASKKIAHSEQAEREELISEMKIIDIEGDKIKDELKPIKEELEELLYKIPNPALDDVKVAKDESENEIIKIIGEKTTFSFQPKNHLEIGEGLDIIDMESAAKASGARFVYLKGDLVRMQFALTQLALAETSNFGFIPTIVPHLITARSMRAMGYLEHGGQDEIYYLQKDNQYLIGTAEQSLGAMHLDKTFKEKELPLRYIGISPSYRREAGSYGKDTKGILRVHQFDKIEMFSVTTPEKSTEEHELILSIEESLMQKLELPYQVIKMVTGDLGLPAAKKYDIETWMPSQEKYRETHSCSTTTDFQARRLNTRYKTQDGKMKYVHMLNGTAFAIGRTMIAIIENYQNEDGTINIPSILQPYMNDQKVIKPRNDSST